MLFYKQDQGIIEVYQARKRRIQKISNCSGQRVPEIPSRHSGFHNRQNKGRIHQVFILWASEASFGV